jgi:polyhydroxyalkanoate synthase
MDLIPKPDQVVSAAANVAHKVLYGGLADLRPMPRTLIDEGVLREVYHYRPRASAREHGDPVLLVTPLAAPALCFDLRRGCSLVEHLVEQGRPTYLVEYGEVSFANRGLGMEHWVDEVVPQAIEEVSRHAGGRPVHLVGWSLGGIFALLAAADRPDLPIASLTSVGAPVDVSQVPLVAPFRPFLGIAGERAGLVTHAYRLLGGAPKPLVRRAFQLSSFNKLVTKPIAVAAKLDDADFLAQVEAVDRFTANMIAYPGRTFGQLYHRLLKGNQLATGTVTMDDREISLADVTVPVLAFGGAGDGIAPVECVRPIVDLLTGVDDLRFEIVPGGHLGMLTGRSARRTTWQILDEWIDAHASAQADQPTPLAKKQARTGTTRKKAPARKATPAKAAATRTAASRRSTRRTASQGAIGANPNRRYGSASSRTLAQK